MSLRAVHKSTGVSRATLRDWLDHPEKTGQRAILPTMCGAATASGAARDYAYLLGLYLGDGCISVGGDPAKGVWALRIACADAWPGLIEECETGNECDTSRQQGGHPAVHWLHRSNCLFAALAVPVPAARPRQEAQSCH